MIHSFSFLFSLLLLSPRSIPAGGPSYGYHRDEQAKPEADNARPEILANLAKVSSEELPPMVTCTFKASQRQRENLTSIGTDVLKAVVGHYLHSFCATTTAAPPSIYCGVYMRKTSSPPKTRAPASLNWQRWMRRWPKSSPCRRYKHRWRRVTTRRPRRLLDLINRVRVRKAHSTAASIKTQGCQRLSRSLQARKPKLTSA
jgi:hypothetical protein